MKTAFIISGVAALLAGCATEDPYANRGGSNTAPAIMRGESANWGTPDEQIPHPPGSTPGTHPSDPRGGTGADDFGGTDRGGARTSRP